VFLTWRVFFKKTRRRGLFRSALAATPSFSRGLIPAIAGRFISSDEGHESRQPAALPLSCPMHAGNKSHNAQKMSPLGGEASDIRRDTDGEHQKKAYEKQK
jgi:hypothetical protein